MITMKLEITIGRQHLLFLAVFAAILVGLAGISQVIAWGSGDPILHGHDAGEVDLSNVCLSDGTNCPVTSSLLHVANEQDYNVNGGAVVAGSWQDRTINKVQTNEITGASLASNRITLPAGTYRISSWAAFFSVGESDISAKLRLQDITNGVTLLHGGSVHADHGSNHLPEVEVNLNGQFNLASQTVIAIQYWASGGSQGRGYAVDPNSKNIYFDAIIVKVA